MKNKTMKPEQWASLIDQIREGAFIHIPTRILIDAVTGILAKQEAEYKKYLEADGDQINHQIDMRKELEEGIERLKQQHKERLEYIKAYIEGTPAKRVKIDVIKKLDQMLQDSDK